MIFEIKRESVHSSHVAQFSSHYLGFKREKERVRREVTFLDLVF
jgi:hypothetical protein